MLLPLPLLFVLLLGLLPTRAELALAIKILRTEKGLGRGERKFQSFAPLPLTAPSIEGHPKWEILGPIER